MKDSLNRLFDLFETRKEAASWKAVFGGPQTQGDTTIIPVASVTYGVGLGVGMAGVEESEEDAEQVGGGGGIAGSSKPVAVIVVTPEKTTVRPVLDRSMVLIAGMVTVAWIMACWTGVIRKVIALRQSQQG